MIDERMQTAAVAYFTKLVLGDIDDGWVAGGAVRDYFTHGMPKSDIDIFFHGEPAFTAAKAKLRKKYGITRENSAFTEFRVRNKRVQLIQSRYFPTADETIAAFDFTVCCAAVTRGFVAHHPCFFEHLAARKLVINALPFPLSTMERMQKYIRKGFSICNEGLLSISTAVRALDLNDPQQRSLEFYRDGTPRFMRFD